LYVFLQVKDSDNLVDVALTLIRNEISSVPIFKSLPDSTGMPLLNLATLPGILKCMIFVYKTMPAYCLINFHLCQIQLTLILMMFVVLCLKLQEQPEVSSFLQSQLVSIPIGTWSPHTGRVSNRELRTLKLNSPLNSCLDLLLQGTVTFHMQYSYCSLLIHKNVDIIVDFIANLKCD
jgi:5'-AMP-activated protein kinase, regulatory gamma subunit